MGTRYHRPGSGLFRDSQHAGVARIDDFVQSFDECDGRKILAPAEFIRNPLALTARGNGSFPDSTHAGVAPKDDFVQSFDECDGRKILAPAEFIRNPLPFTARV